MKFGPRIISDFQRSREAEGRIWAGGYKRDELELAQEKFNLVFPPDLVDLFLDRRPVAGWDWRSDENEIREMIAWPFEGLLFDVENSGLWWPEWGSRPPRSEERAEALRAIVGHAPKLIPLVSHRYIPVDPHEAGNPVFSIYQSDVIYYGANIDDYFDREFSAFKGRMGPIKPIRFWSDLVERSGQAEFYSHR